MKLTVVVDNFCTKPGLLAEWGYSIHLETPDGNLLFDTGGYAHILIRNMRALSVNPSDIRHIVLSHGHYDHVSGLGDILACSPYARVWGAASVAVERRGDADASRLNGGGGLFCADGITSIEQKAEIMPAVTAFIVPLTERNSLYQKNTALWEVRGGNIIPDTFSDDLSLLIHGKHGYSLLLGCAHSGLPNILDYVQKHFGIQKIDTVIGGTHLSAFDSDELPLCIDRLKQFSVKRWRPNHCTGFAAAAALAHVFPDVVMAGAGTVMEF